MSRLMIDVRDVVAVILPDKVWEVEPGSFQMVDAQVHQPGDPPSVAQPSYKFEVSDGFQMVVPRHLVVAVGYAQST